MQVKHNEIDDFNTDIRLLREITSKLPSSLIKRQSMQRIGSLLRAKNQVSSHRQ